ncbi:MAG TPA: cytochrome c oxidase assembly protein [Ktedonobacterales bacterium]|nr:cytochrome c oxidase assembly protein [Ktedonobacterales bacterium]
MLIPSAISLASGPLWLAWNFNPITLLGIAVFTGAYFYALGPLRRRYGWAEGVERWQVATFVTGTVIFTLALISPLDTLGDEYLFSAHMVQHMLICVVAPPLWLLGTPGWMLSPLFRRPAVARAARWVTHPAVAFTLFNGTLWLWHAPTLYDATLSNEYLHIFEHLTFVVTAVIFWWAVLSPVPAVPKVSHGVAILYLFVACQPMVALGALLTFAANPLYHPYVVAPRLGGISALGDQQAGGLIMWLPTNIPYLAVLSVKFFRWVSEQDRSERRAAGEFDDEPGLALETPAPAADSLGVISAPEGLPRP